MINIFKIISDGGIPSKNDPNYSESSFLIANQKKYICGIKVDTFITKDKKLVLVDESVMTKLGIDEEFIKNNEYKKIKNIKYSNKIKSNYLITIDDLLSKEKRNIYIIINLCNKKLSEIEIEALNNYLVKNNSSNLLISSKSNDILERLDYSLHKGKVITTKKDWEYSYEFYISEEKYIDYEIINNKINNNALIFIYYSKDIEKFKKYDNDLYIITPYSNVVYKELSQN